MQLSIGPKQQFPIDYIPQCKKQIQHYVDRNMYVISYSTNIVIAQESLVEWNDNKFCKDEKKMLQHIVKCSWYVLTTSK